MLPEASARCLWCGEEIPLCVDPSEGESYECLVDCSVCCRPQRLRVHYDGRRAVVEAIEDD